MSFPTIKLRPASGRVVRDPKTRRVLKAAGEEKPRSSYWMRRLAAGEVEEIVKVGQPARPSQTVEDVAVGQPDRPSQPARVAQPAKKSNSITKKEGES